MAGIRVLALSLCLFGCAGPQAQQAATESQPRPAAAPQQAATKDPVSRSLVAASPVCGSQTQCKIMWVRAHEALEQLTGMRVRSMSDTAIRTDPPAGPGLLQGTVSKHPLPNGRFELRANFECFPRDPRCGALRDQATNAFNSMVSAAAADVR